MKFDPIAIVGQGCILPGALNSDELWTTVRQGRDVLGPPEPDYWGVSPAHMLTDHKAGPSFDHTWSERGGYVRGFTEMFDPRTLLLDPEDLDGLDPLYLWTIEAARQAIESAGWRAGEVPGSAGVVLGNLVYPTKTMTDLAEKVWRGEQHGIDWRNRFIAGLPANLVANALGLTGGAAAIDAACASSLYAIKLACDRLHDRTADVMLAGGANGASDLFIHVGFSALQALSQSGRSRPFHRDADGLVPAEGAAMLVLRRLEDAIADGSNILGVIRGIGLTNNGRGQGLLAPWQEGQERAMRLAYDMAGLEPQDISLVECHATGTSRGDLTELMTMARIFDGMTGLPIGSMKSNLGHTLSASGAAAIIKVVNAIQNGIRPATLHTDDPLSYIADSPFRLLTQNEPWIADGPRRAAINNFGFGGNNAHLLLEEWVGPAAHYGNAPKPPADQPASDGDIAIVGLSLLMGDGHETAAVAEHLMAGRALLRDDGDGPRRVQMDSISIDFSQTCFPPADLKEALPQQLAILSAALNLDELIHRLPADTTSVFVGMGCDTAVTRFELRWRLSDAVEDPDELTRARDGIAPSLTAAAVVGTMPNIVANRLNCQFDLRGPSFSVSRAQLSGTTALELAAGALRRGEIDAAVVGAVDMSCEPVHEAAARELLGTDEQIPGDAAVVLVLKRAADARRDQDRILALLPADQQPRGEPLTLGNAPGALDLSPALGHAHASSGLVSVAVGALCGVLGVRPDGTQWNSQGNSVVVALTGLAGQDQQLVLTPPAMSHQADASARSLLPARRPRQNTPTWLHLPAHPPAVRMPTAVVASHEPEQSMTTLLPTPLPVPPPLPKVAEAFARVPLGAALDLQLPPEPLTIRHDYNKVSREPARASQDDFGGQTRTGTLWTETDVTAESRWLHTGRMPAGIMLESGRTDRMPVSWAGADNSSPGDRVYRLLGCEVTFLGGLPEIGDTLRFDVQVDGHASLADIALLFFHSDCTIDGKERLQVRNGQAGLFSKEQLASASRPGSGLLWRPEDETVSGPMESTPSRTSRTSLSRADLEALAAGRVWQTLGAGFECAASHTRTPSVPGSDMRLVDEVTEIDFTGGPWGRGYLRAVRHVNVESWLFADTGDDPYLPGPLMYEGAMQAMAVYMTGLGMTLECDGWRFEPVPFETYRLRYRGQVTPRSRELAYEVFVREVVAGPEPTLFADLLCTVDGLPAFHCRRMGLRLSPGWPMDLVAGELNAGELNAGELNAGELTASSQPRAVAEADGFSFDEKAMLAWAGGKPSMAFGPRYQEFDNHRKLIRLPGAPYNFISRVSDVAGDMGAMTSGAEVVVEYDIPEDAWYFAANGRPTMPNAVLMEVALQPCGWLAAYAGCPLCTDVDLYFRNLDGTGVQHREITPSTPTLRTKVVLKSIAQASDTILVSFDAETHADDELVYTIDTVFGFFRRDALEQQVGLPATDEQRSALELPCEATVVELAGPGRSSGPGPRLAGATLLMIDRVTGRWCDGGSAGLGRWRAVKDVDPTEWFFKAHFYRDPVQPGSLGIEALLQLLQFAMLDLGLGEEAGAAAHFEPVALDEPVTWRYRGQVLPANKLITSLVEITRITRDDDGILAAAEGSLWVDGRRIYSVTNLAMRIKGQLPHARSSAAADPPAVLAATMIETVIDPGRDTWIADHCPTYTIPTLPMMSVMDLFAQAAGQVAGAAKVVEVTHLRVERWIVVDSPKRLRVVIEPTGPGRCDARLEVWRDAPRPVMSRWETHAHATLLTANQYPSGPTDPPPLHGTVPFANPYETGAIFHGPAFSTVLDGARIGRNGSSGTLAVNRCKVPIGRLHPGLLDGAMHLVPLGAWSVWTNEDFDVKTYVEAKDSTVALPHRVEWARFYNETPQDGEVDVEIRCVGFDDAENRMPVIELWLSAGGNPWACIRVVGILLPKGPLGQAGGLQQRAFLGQRRAVPAMSLSERLEPGAVMLDADRVATMSWLKGTLQAVYCTESIGNALLSDVAAKEAVVYAAHGAIHPSQVHTSVGRVSCPALPLERIALEVRQVRPGTVRAEASLQTDWQPIRTWWTDKLDMPPGWFGDLLKWGLLSRYARHVIVTDPEAMAAVRGRPVLLLGNHQVMIESLLAMVIASWVTDTKVVPIAGIKLQDNWIGKLTRFADAQAGRDLGIMRYFDQQTPEQFFGLIDDIKSDTAAHGVSTLVHPDGTRYFRSGQRVERLTSTLLDMALEMSMPIVPLFFAGGLPEEPVDPKLEVPYRQAAQDYIFGRPIMPEELRALAYARRRRHVIDAINALAPFSDAPHEPNLALERKIAAVAPGAPPLESVWDCIEDALDALPADWRSTISMDDWTAIRSTQPYADTSATATHHVH
ncbi:beta-ketoacyl synthase N-terminal-like domain-containing protein [Mycobacterium angelicum]|uniref:Uncharacterized protein n=1 Tax=Mycobacterium angelicum TaxID=470074 RepID=A0A1W9ZYT3_MYCAN|nr:beta-ketoacyl synthase N-terminal-like domain-containing protein [Mycobacterium angelicum]MCV7199010.1 polyketide synthase dehydratase domain-containing protein [Mycobacterium angelicum]ORA22973.1 hypothetical protein BST12_08160 [Mycobacterium angelicum]